MKHKKIIFQALIGVLIIAALAYFLNPKQLESVFLSVQIKYFVFAMLTYIAMNLIMSYRLKIIFSKLGKKISMKDLILAHFGGMLASDVTPGRSGYLITPFLIKDKVPVESGFSAIFGVQIIDFFVKIIGAILAVGLLVYTAKINSSLLGLVGLGIIIVTTFTIILAMTLWSKKAKKILTRLEQIPVAGKLFTILTKKMDRFQSDGKTIISVYPQLICLTGITWFAKGIEWMFLGMALGFNFPIYVYILLQPLITILQFVPISPAGLGFQESGGMVVFLLLGVASASAFVFNILARVVLILPNLIGIYPIITKGVNVFEIKE